MKVLKITENFGQYIAETSAGQRASGASAQSALAKLRLQGVPLSAFDAVASIFDTIPDAAGPSQIGEGVSHA